MALPRRARCHVERPLSIDAASAAFGAFLALVTVVTVCILPTYNNMLDEVKPDVVATMRHVLREWRK